MPPGWEGQLKRIYATYEFVSFMKEPLDVRQLRALVMIAKTGSFTKAANELFLSQSAVSHCIRALENDLGCRVLHRVGKKVQLTPAGEELLHLSEKILDQLSSVRASIEQRNKWGSSRLSIGASLSICEYLLPPILQKTAALHPDRIISVSACDTGDAIERMRSSDLDLAVVIQPLNDEGISYEPLFEDELEFITSSDHSWVQSKSPKDFQSEQLLLYSRNSYTFRAIDAFFRRQGITLNPRFEISSFEAIKQLIKLGAGISIMAPWVAAAEIAQGTLVCHPLGKSRLKRRWGIVYRKGKTLNIAEENFIRLLRKHASKISKLGPELEVHI